MTPERHSPPQVSAPDLNAVWEAAALEVALGRDPLPALATLPRAAHGLELESAAGILYDAIPRALDRPPAAWSEIWTEMRPGLERVLSAVGAHVGLPGLERAIGGALHRLLVPHLAAALPSTFARAHAVAVEITAPIDDVRLDDTIDRLQLLVQLEGAFLGVLELPVCDGRVPATVIRDALADRFAWQVLGRFFERTAYGDVEMRRDGALWSAWRRGEQVARDLPDDPAERFVALHDAIGWSELLSQLGPDRHDAGTAAPSTIDRIRMRVERSDAWRTLRGLRWTVVDLTAPIERAVLVTTPLLVEVRLAGAPIVVMPLPTKGTATVASLRSAAIDASGFELCRVAVREALIGAPLDGAGSLRERLARAAARRGPSNGATERPVAPPGVRLAPGWRGALAAARTISPDGLVVANRAPTSAGTSASRHAVLPAQSASLLGAMARGVHVPTLQKSGGPVPVVYSPDALWQPRDAFPSPPPPVSSVAAERAGDHARMATRLEFEALFAAGADPWRYGSEYEQIKYEQTLEVLSDTTFPRALEIACAEGHFTRQLAPRVGTLLATDISELALERAAVRCADHANVEYQQADLATGALPGGFDLVVCSEMLYFVGGRDELPGIARTIAGALVPGGHFVTAHAHVLVDAPNETGFDWEVPFGVRYIREVFSAVPGLTLVRELRTPLYRVLLFRRDGTTSPATMTPAQTIQSDRFGMPETKSAELIRWGGGEVRRPAPRARETTTRLPILMYHRVSPTGDQSRDRFRVTPEAFERQLRYLRDAGFRGITLDEWRDESLAHRAVDGRAILLTFDDGFADFDEHAWPLLERYGFGALVFLATGLVGRSNEWDGPVTAATEPLMDWPTLGRLRDEGVLFGAHSITHRRLTTLGPADAVAEIAGSLASVREHLGVPCTAFAYPFGAHDGAIAHLAGACGVTCALGAGGGRAGWSDSLLALPRLEVRGDADFATFVALVSR